MTINRFCSSGLQAIALAAGSSAAAAPRRGARGGTESMSLVPMGGTRSRPTPRCSSATRTATSGMGMTAELVAQKYGIDREKADAFALASHQKALAAIEAGASRTRSCRSP
jgi:acetyl-CoA acyltransferase